MGLLKGAAHKGGREKLKLVPVHGDDDLGGQMLAEQRPRVWHLGEHLLEPGVMRMRRQLGLKIERVGLERARIRRRSSDKFDRKHHRIYAKRDPQGPPPARPDQRVSPVGGADYP